MDKTGMYISILINFFFIIYLSHGQPVINDQPMVRNLKEATFIQIPVVDVNCVDPMNGRVAVTVLDVTSSPTVNHCSNCFQAYNLNTALPNDWKLYYIPGKLNYFTANRYDVRVSCRDSNSLISLPATIGINVVPNAPPFYDPIYRSINVTNSFSRPVGYSIITATATDVNSDSLFYSFTTSFQTDIFQINAATGEITLKKPLGGLCRSNILLYLTATDSIHPQTATLTLNINFLQMNLAAIITNMNRVVSIEENAGALSIPVNRIDAHQPAFSCSIAVQVASMASKFTFNPVSTSIDMSSFNYEVDANTNITVQCTDGLCPSADKWLYIQILNINDIPTLNPPTQSLVVEEGFINIQPNLVITDEDVNDQHTYSIVSITPPTPGFTLNSNTGRLRSTVDFRVDKNDRTNLDFLIEAKDTKGGQSTNTVSIRLSIYDVNDHPPVLDVTSFEYRLEECHTLGILDQLTATDLDGGDNGVVRYEGKVEGPVTVYNNGTIYLSSPPQPNTFTSLEVYAVDLGFNPGVKKSPTPAVITVIGLPCSTVTTPSATTDPVTAPATSTTAPELPLITFPPNQRKDNVKDLVWITAACVLGLIITAILIVVLCRCHKAARSRQKTVTISNPSKKKPVKPSNIRKRSSVVAEIDNNKQTQKNYFKNDVSDNYRVNYKNKESVPPPVATS